MGWDIYLEDKEGSSVIVDHLQYGSTQVVGGTDEAHMSLTYNYAPLYYRHLDKKHGLQFLHEKRARETLPVLQKAIGELSDDGSEKEDYWEMTPYNAKFALRILARWAEQHPDATWYVS